MSIAIASVLHVVAAVIWVGGMFFAYVCLRPAVGALEPPARCRLWRVALGRFFTDLSEARSAVFYRAVARFGKAYFDFEKQYLAMRV